MSEPTQDQVAADELDVAKLQAIAKARMVTVREKIAAIKARTADKQAVLDQMANEHAALTARMNALAEEIKAVEYPEVFDLKRELGKLARIAGGY